MLFPVLIQVSHDLSGLAPAALFEQVTGVSQMTFRRGRAYAALTGRNREAVLRHRDAWLTTQALARGATVEEAAEQLVNTPDGIASQIVYGLGLLSDGCSVSLVQLARSLDEADVRSSRCADDDDLPGFLREIGPTSALGPDYCAALSVSGLTCPVNGASAGEQQLWTLALTRRAHMALSLLAAIDVEMSRWNERVLGTNSWRGRSRFATLIAAPAPHGFRGIPPSDPIARLVDLIGAQGMRIREGRWPSRRPTVASLQAQAERSGAIAGDAGSFIRKLRSGERPMTRTAFRTLVRSQFAQSRESRQVDTDTGADLAGAYAYAAHVLTRLMPVLPGHPGHRDRRGWRDAYVSWWQRHATNAPMANSSAAETVPDWLTGST